jgi:hypothetical protein
MKVNYPCLLTEKKNTSNDAILNHFSLVHNENELQEQKRYYVEPVIIQSIDLINSAKRIMKQFKPV